MGRANLLPTAPNNKQIAPKAAVLGKTTLLSDFDLYRQILEKAHAGLYKYHSQKSVDSIFGHYRRQISSTTTLLAFYRYCSSILAYIGSLHDDISLPQNYLSKIAAQPVFFPYPVSLINKQLLVNIDSQAIPAGAEILSINGQSIPSLLPRLYKYYTTDGLNTTGKLTGISAAFSLFYRYELGPATKFKVMYKAFQAPVARTVTLKAITYKEHRSFRKQRHSLYLDTLLDDRYQFELIDSLNTAILTVNSFSLGGPDSKTHAAYKQFLLQCFTTLKEKHISNLVVDIRKNGAVLIPTTSSPFLTWPTIPLKKIKRPTPFFKKYPTANIFIPTTVPT
ncbi:hypothetical protein [Paraflavitalea speifideaquila]|uniref:hypothetical protein n=1 Tax=Paraflavitalea speifideaquila TaxID=3076558 RepID=UPI0028EB4CA7|nr:hypothetical protein [Paraflavitalea speifideiaquila]